MTIVNWCNQNQGFVMAFLTMIYVIATVFILISNSRSARIMKKTLMLTDKIQRENAKLQLHTKRLDAFDTLNQLVIKIHEEGPKTTYIDELLKTCNTVYYLFDDTIDVRVKKIVFYIQRLRRVEFEFRNLTKTEKDKTQLDEHKATLHTDILTELNELTEQVNDYLDIGEIGIDLDTEKQKDSAKANGNNHKENNNGNHTKK